MKFTERDEKTLDEIHPDLQKVVRRAAELTDRPFRVHDGARTLAEQKEYVRRGTSKTLRSRHIPGKNGYSHAVDLIPLVNGNITWDWKYYYPLGEVMKKAAEIEGVPIEWGGDWKSFKDGPHFQLPWSLYPGDKPVDQEQPTLPETIPTEFSKKIFFDTIRSRVNLTTENVEGFDKLLDFGYQRNTPLNQLAYILATVWWETAQRMQPVREAYWKSEDWRRRNLRYYPHYGRGLVQTTWLENYEKLEDITGQDFTSSKKDMDKLLSWEWAIPTVFISMETGLYTGKSLDDYIDDIDEDDAEDLREYKNARRIINGTDKDDTIARLALMFENALRKAGYSVVANNSEVEQGLKEITEEVEEKKDATPKPTKPEPQKTLTIGGLLSRFLKWIFNR